MTSKNNGINNVHNTEENIKNHNKRNNNFPLAQFYVFLLFIIIFQKGNKFRGTCYADKSWDDAQVSLASDQQKVSTNDALWRIQNQRRRKKNWFQKEMSYK